MANLVVTVTNSDGATATKTSTIDVTAATIPLHVELSFTDGKFLAFDQGSASDLGSFVSVIGGFTQRCFLQRAIGNGDYRDGFVCFFRPDQDGKRSEIVIEYGCEVDFSVVPPKTVAGIPAVSTPGYTAKITGGSLSAAVTQTVPYHRYATRWRYQSAPRPLVRTAADLLTMKAVLPLSGTYLFGASLPPTRSWEGPMGLGGLSAGMPTTGARPDIGPITAWQAAWLVTGLPAMEASWRAGAEATGSMPFWVRDLANGNLVDPRNNAAYLDANHSTYMIPRGPQNPPGQFYLDAAHMPNAALMPALLTDDPYFWEGAQATGLYHILETNLYRLQNKTPCTVNYSQPRGFAWGMNMLFLLADFSPTTVPSCMRPRIFWANCLPDNLKYMTRYLTATVSPCTTVFNTIYPVSRFESFMNDYVAMVLGRALWSGLHEDWRQVTAYAATPRMAMSDPNGDWGQGRFPTPYWVPVLDARLGASATGSPDWGPAVPFSSNTPTTWAELFQDYSLYAVGGVQKQPNWTDPSTWPADQLTTFQSIYHPYARAALAALAQAGLPGALARHDWMKARMTATNAGSEYTWAISPQ